MSCCADVLTPQCKVAIVSTPALTRALLVINIAIYVVGFLVPRDSAVSATEAPGHFCLSATSVAEDATQYYRIISTAFFHLSLMHIAFNSMTLHNVGSAIERRTGTLCFALCTLILIPGCGLMNVAASFAFNFLGYDSSMKECAAGFSGVLFAYVTLQALHRHSTPYSVYGFFTVPAKWYPPCMLLITQILLPQSSFVGHLGGILAGIVYSLAESRLPTCSSCFKTLESIFSCPAVSACCFFVPYPDPLPIQNLRIVPGVIVGQNFFPSPSLHPAPVEAVDPPASPPLPWLHRLRSWFSSGTRSPLCSAALFGLFLLRVRYQQVGFEMQPPQSPSNAP